LLRLAFVLVRAAIDGSADIVSVVLVMKKYDFTLVLSHPSELTEEIAEALFEAGCDDGTPGMAAGVFLVDFHREADSLEEAIQSAIATVKSAGCQVQRVEIEAEAMAPQP
jgi:hypothetical protein